jgi:hypothetical protein
MHDNNITTIRHCGRRCIGLPLRFARRLTMRRHATRFHGYGAVDRSDLFFTVAKNPVANLDQKPDAQEIRSAMSRGGKENGHFYQWAIPGGLRAFDGLSLPIFAWPVLNGSLECLKPIMQLRLAAGR